MAPSPLKSTLFHHILLLLSFLTLFPSNVTAQFTEVISVQATRYTSCTNLLSTCLPTASSCAAPVCSACTNLGAHRLNACCDGPNTVSCFVSLYSDLARGGNPRITIVANSTVTVTGTGAAASTDASTVLPASVSGSTSTTVVVVVASSTGSSSTSASTSASGSVSVATSKNGAAAGGMVGQTWLFQSTGTFMIGLGFATAILAVIL